MEFELRPYHRNMPEAELLEDLRAVAARIHPKRLTQHRYTRQGRFSSSVIKKRFGTWQRALVRVGLEPSQYIGVAPDAILADIQRVAKELNVSTLTKRQYEKGGRYSVTAVCHSFGTWRNAVQTAGLEPGSNYNIPNEELFANMEHVWRRVGRQPTTSDMTAGGSKYPWNTYVNRFGGFRKALEAFVAWIKSRSSTINEPGQPPSSEIAIAPPVELQTPRTVNWRLRFLTFRRDAYRCRACGRSPANDPSVELEVDHIEPWVKGGETLLENLQTLCAKCNSGKSDLAWEAGEETV